MADSDTSCLGMVTVHMPCEFGYLRIARQNVRDFCARSGLSEFKTAQLEMALDEAVTNIIEHSYGHKPDGSSKGSTPDSGIQLILMQFDDRVEVQLVDSGKGFDYASTNEIAPDSYVDTQRERGLGLYIIRNFVDEAEYTPSESEGNRMRLIKKI